MTSINALRKGLLFLLLLPAVSFGEQMRVEFGGHTKLAVAARTFPGNSLFRELVGSTSFDGQGGLRLNLELRQAGWSFDANYQLAYLGGDAFGVLINSTTDRRRLFRLTDTIDSGKRSVLLQRLDRVWVGHTSEKTVLRFGRQALSWGNGLFYAPMDLVNLFDPATVDTEYKAGDDMLYAQYLRSNGADVQGAVVFRRDPVSGDIDAGQATIAAKYHGFAGAGEFDVLVAEHYGDQVLGLGAGRSLGGAQWNADLVLTRTNLDQYVQLSTNLNYSWTGAGKNMTGAIEYHYNGFGQRSGDYGASSLAGNPDLLAKLARGEMFTLARHYLAGAVAIEMSPLWTVSPTLLANIEDPSALLQIVTNYSLSDNLTVLGSVNIPLGGSGTEFGGVESDVPGRYLASGAGVFAQIAWYF